MTRQANTTNESFDGWQLFEAEAQYAESIFRNALGDVEASIAAARRAVEIKPDYAPAVLTMGSIEYQLGKEAEGRRLFRSLLLVPDQSKDLWEIVDKAGNFLIQSRRYADALELYEGAVARFPDRADLYQGLGCCAGHEGLFDRAVMAFQKALDLELESSPQRTHACGVLDKAPVAIIALCVKIPRGTPRLDSAREPCSLKVSP